ncbi:YAP-binding/ALF4/Glomulin [Sphaerosporella brunnea]|uniref:YAP-binding/ALF4/Glomulin n=1 Tax=Sphaerosporella brunnea TaxID=1250544 RepID=A0A5J5F7V2_9PEZI|nr:YAP-binding/ALF4/Glomulin [Sphaerosporella brunnea]
MAERQEVTLEKAISSIRTAADELSPDEFIDYSVILDVHLNWALEELSPEDQYEFLSSLKEVLESHEELAKSIAWDLIIVLLPFLDSPLPKTSEIAEAIIAHSAQTGNPREVYIKVLQGLSSLAWASETESEEEEEEEEDAEHSGDEEDQPEPTLRDNPQEDPALHAQHTLKRFSNLLSALAAVHPRISTRVPSKFLSAELSTLLIAFTKAVETVEGSAITGVVEQLLSFLKVVRPQLALARRASSINRPPLPPRTSTARSVAPTATADMEAQLQARLIGSFLTHVLSGYLLRTKRQAPPKPEQTEPEDHSQVHPAMRALGGGEERGLEIGWAGKYDEEVLRPNKSKVPGGRTPIDVEREGRDAQSNVKAAVDEISFMCERLGLKTEELLEVCQSSKGDGLSDDDEDDHSEIPAPKTASEIPLSKQGALFLLAHRLSMHPTETPTHLQIYPHHSEIAEAFMIYSGGSAHPAIIDAILFLGALFLETGGLGDIPESSDAFFIYLQIFSVISTNASSPQQRFLANNHVARCLRAHPSEAVRLAYVRDTLEHCPFESVKAAVVGILKDEIVHATTPVQRTGASVPSTPINILGTPLGLSEIFDVLFPDMDAVFAKNDWKTFKEVHPCIAATLNLYLLLLLNADLRHRLGVDAKFREKVEMRFVQPIRKRLEGFKEKESQEGGMNVAMLGITFERVEEAEKGIHDD